jgi:hypothetical protein
MKINLHSGNHLMRRMQCHFLGHQLKTTRNVTNHLREFKCVVCEIELTQDLSGAIIYLSRKQKEINDTLFNLHQKRKHHL